MSQVNNKKWPFVSPVGVRNKKYPAPQRPSIQELKQKYESPTSNNNSITAPKPKSPKMLSKSKVKQMASMFNNRISQIIRRDTETKRYTTLANELSPEVKAIVKPSLPKPLPLPMPRLHSTKEKAPVPSPRTKSKAKIQQTPICFVAEDVFAKLTVKDKALLYTQFIGDMSKKNSKFVKHAEMIEANVKKEMVHGEVVNEKQETVKQLLADLEAKCTFPKQTISAIAAQKINSIRERSRKRSTQMSSIKSKEFEDVMNINESHISTLTVTLHSNPLQNRKPRRARSLPRHKTHSANCHNDLHNNIELNHHKRSNDEMRSTLPIEAFAPPKKIRRSRAEHLAPNTFFQNQQLENLFYSWLNERHQNEVSEKATSPNRSENVEELPKSDVDKLLEEAIAKLETVEITQNEEISPKDNDEPIEKKTPKEDDIKTKVLNIEQPIVVRSKSTPRKKKPAPAIPQQQEIGIKPLISSESSTTSSTLSSAKNSEAEESESGLCSLVKTTSDESQMENHEKLFKESQHNDVELIQPLKPLRKKKLRRSLTWKKDCSLVEAKVLPTTDSESDCKKSKNKKFINKPQPLELLTPQADESLVETNFMELDKTLMKVNSPRKIKSAYTLTAFSPPPYTEKDHQDMENSTKKQQHKFSNSENQLEKDMLHVGKSNSTEPRSLADSFDQGFETGSNELDSPIRPARKSSLKRQNKSYSPLFFKLSSESRKISVEPSSYQQPKIENPTCFSTPIKEQPQQNFNDMNHGAVQQQLFSPISQYYKNRRRSLYDSESRRSSLAMQVIREDQPLENHEIQSPRSITSTGMFFANASTLDMTDMSGLDPQKTSSFWIKSGDFLIALDVFYNDAERLRMLYEIFSQKSCDSQDMHFGIDDYKFSVHNAEDQENITKRFAQSKEHSHYWFSTGDLAIPFKGKLMSSEKIQRFLQFIKLSVEETGILRFGVDATEFSSASEFWTQSPKFSMESNYSILVGLQSGNSNGLEGRGKYAWPHSKPVPVSDLDQSDFECEDFEENESGRLSFSPFGSNQYDLASLDSLFDEEYSPTEKNGTIVPTMNTLQQQQRRLSLVQEKIANYSEPSNLSSDALDALKGTPEYINKLKSIVANISRIGCSNSGFNECDLEQLECYMFFLSRYADICLNNCSDHMDKILDAMMNRKSMKSMRIQP